MTRRENGVKITLRVQYVGPRYGLGMHLSLMSARSDL